MAQNGTGIEFGKSEHVCRRRISRATTISADFIVLGQRCGVQVFGRKVGHMSRRYPVLLSWLVRSVGERAVDPVLPRIKTLVSFGCTFKKRIQEAP